MPAGSGDMSQVWRAGRSRQVSPAMPNEDSPEGTGQATGVLGGIASARA